MTVKQYHLLRSRIWNS